ncbi:MAG: hypothetical protein JNL52_03640 [Flavobacteriales bacterium]|nr:hypothetical protein [Flavobacteriales bacterium]
MSRARYRNVSALQQACSLLGSCPVGRFFVWNFVDIRDHRKFRSRSRVISWDPFRHEEAVAAHVPMETEGKDGAVLGKVDSWSWNSNVAIPERGGAKCYSYKWWLPSGEGDLMALGFLGQFTDVVPKLDLVMVCLGSSNTGLDRDGVFRVQTPGYE